MDSVVATHMPDLAMMLDQAIQDHRAGFTSAAEAGYPAEAGYAVPLRLPDRDVTDDLPR